MPLYTALSLVTEVMEVISRRRSDTCTAMRGDRKGGGQVAGRDGGSYGLIIK